MSTRTRMVNQTAWVGCLPAHLGTSVVETVQGENGWTTVFTVPAGYIYRVFNVVGYHVNNAGAEGIASVSFRTTGATKYFVHYGRTAVAGASPMSIHNFSTPLELVPGDMLRVYSDRANMLVLVSVWYEVVLGGGVL